ncbi:DNA mismatch repair protein MutL [Cricetibacter osteomyelitidis]|uniref:DNA mismatch repair protein MutL n=1 Tax=Cricetibacter osteomyelitidis TaxID=1521931 RepID=A0A4V2T218_9PAST|nr:DNA mismatch repair endonuclease MutL [Cricetibacter osteomyelitidis]TCP95723.1 DNA mismatch repair protein MutL [Cricetibacter osteomyelitidis]
MPIQILPPQLANQIAAGEVVERPSSVVKELVENSLDAGATQIHVDIENGGTSLIRIRDNGIGIPKAELSLALARHATSKITCLDDLEAILSLGFRGEALASISSVSRLTLTSRTAEQNEAWQVYAEGRDMETTVKPASHPVGTTVEVANLFFNTPARRKFLRTDKTEFGHIDEVIRRIALAKLTIAFTLTHNGKIIRQYKQAVNDQQKLKRIAAICGDDFVSNALHIDWKHNDLHLSGWVALPSFNRNQNDLAYSYINGRMVRDKVINHAIRQAYAEHLNSELFPAFVLFLDLNPNDVDVNVHPTKHEVRFQQSRLVHDFIYQGIANALHSEPALDLPLTEQSGTERIPHNQISEPLPLWQVQGQTQGTSKIEPNRSAAGKNIFQERSKSSYNPPKFGKYTPHFYSPHFYSPHFSTEGVNKTEQKAYAELIGSQPRQTPLQEKPISVSTTIATHLQTANNVLQVLTLVQNKALLLQQNQQLYLLPLTALQHLKFRLNLQNPQAQRQALLIPVTFKLDDHQQAQWQQQKDWFAQLGFSFDEHLNQHRITLTAVPQCLRQQNLQKCVISVLSQQITEFSLFLTALLEQIEFSEITILADAVNILTEVETLADKQLLQDLLINVDLSDYL